MSAEISIIVPAYNSGRYLRRCIESIVNQSYTDWELLIADDGSADDTGRIAEDYARIDARITVIQTDHKGVSSARNSCLNIARGAYITFIDSDDSIDPDYLKELITRAKQSDADITQCSFRYLYDDGKTSPDPDANDAVYRGQSEILHAHFRGQQGDIRLSVWAKLIRNNAVSDLRFDTELNVYEDAYYIYQCCRRAKSVCCFSKPLYNYIQHDSSTTHSSLPDIWRDYFRMYEMEKLDFPNDAAICKNIDRRQAETALWLMGILVRADKTDEFWEIRKKTLKFTGSVIGAKVPLKIKMKLIGVALAPHVYIMMLKGRKASGDA